MFKSGDSHAVWTWVQIWKYLKWAKSYLYDDIYMESVADQTDPSPMFFVRENVWKITDDTILYREVQCKKRDILMF